MAEKQATGDKNLYIIITCCFQNDFCEKLDNQLDVLIKKAGAKEKITRDHISDLYKHKVHIDLAETERLWKDGKLEKFIQNMMQVAANAYSTDDTTKEYQFVHTRDWHDNTDIKEVQELGFFGTHCIIGTHGAKFISPLDNLIKEHLQFNIVVDSNSLNCFDGTNLKRELDSIIETSGCDLDHVSIGIIGLITNIKILFLAYDLTVTYHFPNVYICPDLSAAFTSDEHQYGIGNISNIGLAQAKLLDEFRDQFQIPEK